MWGGSGEAVSKPRNLAVCGPGSTAISANASYFLQHGHVEGSFKEPMRPAFSGNAGVPPAATKQIKESKRQSKQDDAKTCHTNGGMVVL